MNKSGRKNQIIVSVCIMLIIIIASCGGLAKLKLQKDDRNKEGDEWTTVFSSNTRHNAVNGDIEPPYKILWKEGYKSVITDQPLVIADYLVFTTRNGNLGFLNIMQGQMVSDGRVAPGFDRAPVIQDNILYFGASLGENTLVAMNLTNMKKKWEAKLGHINTSPLIWKDLIIAGNHTGKMYAVNKNNGKQIWHHELMGSAVGLPAESNGRLYFTDIKGNLYCLNAGTGEKIWTTALEPNSYCGPVIGDGLIYTGSTSGIFYAISEDSGKIVWYSETGGSIYGNAAYSDGIVYVGNNSHKIYAFASKTGEKLWDFTTGGIINTAPMVGRDYIYFASWDKRLYVLARQIGEEIYHMEFNKPIKTAPLLFEDKLFIHTSNDDIICLTSRENDGE